MGWNYSLMRIFSARKKKRNFDKTRKWKTNLKTAKRGVSRPRVKEASFWLVAFPLFITLIKQKLVIGDNLNIRSTLVQMPDGKTITCSKNGTYY